MTLIGENNVINKWALLLLSGILLFCSGLTQAEEINPYVMLEEVATKTFSRIKEERQLIEADPELLRKVMEEELLPYVDYNFSALKVLGKHYKKVPREKIPEYISVFRSYLITTYALAMGYYNGQDVEFQPVRDVTDERTVTVRAVVKEPGRPDINLAFKLRKNKKTNEWKAYDMVAEGISLLSSKQSEFESILRKDGLQKVIDMMKNTVNKPINIDPEKKGI
ncbi:ABC transporter substrate-binding protein [uncultured Paraglaciecola sp.]|jgi:phospholipid transport system substrate-binding protein|uniref:MlaC/ttg2D family ABC transporter substrate-binding protein n=1 Tax=uncultured Paraglaciecola sp. TaxID=1765024 RepID=UPI0025DDC82E|nr:ABC transporter substrate-binding protein [uncultured Paraglaciecola sp.]